MSHLMQDCAAFLFVFLRLTYLNNLLHSDQLYWFLKISADWATASQSLALKSQCARRLTGKIRRQAKAKEHADFDRMWSQRIIIALMLVSFKIWNVFILNTPVWRIWRIQSNVHSIQFSWVCADWPNLRRIITFDFSSSSSLYLLRFTQTNELPHCGWGEQVAFWCIRVFLVSVFLWWSRRVRTANFPQVWIGKVLSYLSPKACWDRLLETQSSFLYSEQMHLFTFGFAFCHKKRLIS